MSKYNHQLQEVLCGFRFNSEKNSWDSTYFGKYYEVIQDIGYTEKQEQKGFEVKFDLKPDLNKKFPEAQYSEAEARMLFKNSSNNEAILMANNYISFHKLPPYENWEVMVKNQVEPGLERYKKIGLGNELNQVQMLYLNKYEFDEKEKLSDKFHFIPAIEDFGIGTEKTLQFQSQYDLETNLIVQIKLNAHLTDKKSKVVFLECSCISHNIKSNDSWRDILKQVHDQNNLVFNKITKT